MDKMRGRHAVNGRIRVRLMYTECMPDTYDEVLRAAGRVGEVCGLGERGLSGALPPFVHAEVLRIRFLRVSLIRGTFEVFENTVQSDTKASSCPEV